VRDRERKEVCLCHTACKSCGCEMSVGKIEDRGRSRDMLNHMASKGIALYLVFFPLSCRHCEPCTHHTDDIVTHCIPEMR
jgi:hypothetical protein